LTLWKRLALRSNAMPPRCWLEIRRRAGNAAQSSNKRKTVGFAVNKTNGGNFTKEKKKSNSITELYL
jgi:hypothetical protein